VAIGNNVASTATLQVIDDGPRVSDIDMPSFEFAIRPPEGLVMICMKLSPELRWRYAPSQRRAQVATLKTRELELGAWSLELGTLEGGKP
jgi:hypothetical protein